MIITTVILILQGTLHGCARWCVRAAPLKTAGPRGNYKQRSTGWWTVAAARKLIAPWRAWVCYKLWRPSLLGGQVQRLRWCAVLCVWYVAASAGLSSNKNTARPRACRHAPRATRQAAAPRERQKRGCGQTAASLRAASTGRRQKPQPHRPPCCRRCFSHYQLVKARGVATAAACAAAAGRRQRRQLPLRVGGRRHEAAAARCAGGCAGAGRAS